MNFSIANCLLAILMIVQSLIMPSLALQQLSWQPQQVQQSQFTAARQPIAADLQNQVSALSAQLAAANRQLQYFQQQLGLAATQGQPQAEVQAQQPLPVQTQPQQQQVTSQQAFLAQQQQQLALQQQSAAQPGQQFFGQPQTQQQRPQPVVSTLVDELIDPRFANEPTRIFQAQQQQPFQHQQPSFAQPEQQIQFQPQQQQQQQQPQPTSTTVGPPSIESSFQAVPQREQQLQPQSQPQQQVAPANMASPHNPPKNDDKFSIGLGVLSPGYTQKFGNTALDFNQDKNGFSFTLSNNGHNNQPQSSKQVPASSMATEPATTGDQ